MIITCPSCQAQFSVPEAAIGPRGRAMRCAKCGEKWHQDPLIRLDDIPLEMPPAMSADPVPRPNDSLVDQDFEDLNKAFKLDGLGGSDDDKGGLDFDSLLSDAEGEGEKKDDAKKPDGEEEEDPFARIAELMMQSSPEPIPDVFAAPPPKPPARRKGAAGLILLLLVLLLVAVGGVMYFFQDRVIDQFPQLAPYYEELGLRNEVVGLGLAFSNYQSERLSQDNSEILVVRGVITNTTDMVREIPLLRLALYEDQRPLQERVINPPQVALDPHATIGFRITLEQPDPHASRFEVTFTNARPPVDGKDAKPPVEGKK